MPPKHPKLARRRLEELIEEAIVDADGESEQHVGFLTMLEEHLACPFTTTILGTPVRVERVARSDPTGVVAICRAALLYSLVESCALAGVPPFDYLKDVLLRVAAPPQRRIG